MLVWAGEFAAIAEAFTFEKQVQGWSRRKREALIRGDFDALPALSRRGHLRPPE
jgi:putative endonuclease